MSWQDSKGKLTTLTANRGVFYYRAGLKDYQTFQPFAPDLRDMNDQRITWFCGINDYSMVSSVATRCQCLGWSDGRAALKVGHKEMP